MNQMQIGRIVAKALHRSKDYNRWQASSKMELAMCRYYGVAYSLDDEKILGEALRKTAVRLSQWLGRNVEVLMDAYEDYAHSYCPYPG